MTINADCHGFQACKLLKPFTDALGRISTRCGITYCYSLFGDWLVAVGACVPFKVTNEQLKDDACTYTIPSVQNKTASLICLENVSIFSYCVYRCGVVPSG